jgi:polysaccharide export outer membrane protein
VDPHEYTIGPGDQLRLFVLNNPELTADVSVRPDGKISAPLVNEMMAVGKTPQQLGLDLQEALKVFVRNPTVSVIVSTARSALSQVRVVGQAVSPRALPFRKNMTVLDLVIEVGGLSPFAAGNRAKIVRNVDGKSQEIRVRLSDLIDGGDMSQNVMLAPGDVLIVPQTRF